ncbi:MAG: glycosyl transferase [Geobacteraceae bacterium GWC2_58_44]|nr:MAG: glycosyl transferase [Geobacteraceae bacterium GWC2_58_44]HBG04833.1 undecaprenyl/decaprenyl-phosphate alpha-N-acetylglucosaminyl 1-phosphate transferase [Geobacter sp.]
MIFLSTLLVSVLITIALTPAFSALALRFQLVDLPNERKVHQVPVPRVGGIAMALGAFIPIICWRYADSFVQAYLVGAAILVLFGAVDDFRDLSPRIKFLGQIAAALSAVFLGGIRISNLGMLAPENYLLPGWLAVPLTVVAIVGVTNAINLSDGLDGLAGGISLLIFAGIGYLAYLVGDFSVGLISLALGGALFGFLRFNTHPASIFMGDSGSQFLGFSAITLSLGLTQGRATALSPILPLILLGFPILDTLTVMVARISRGRSPFSADRNHFHHNLMALGFLHPESVLIIYLFQTFLLLASVHFRFYSDWSLLGGYLVFSLLVLAGFSHAARTRRTVRRLDFFDAKIAGRLRLLKREGVVIRYSFRLFESGVPLLLFITCLVAQRPPLYGTLICAVSGAAILIVCRFRNAWLPGLLRFVLYLLIPFSVYLGGGLISLYADTPLLRFYNGSFGAVALLIILVSKFSRRKSGFRSSPMDFLIGILALVVPNLPEQQIQEYQVGLTAAKILLLYFSFEVLQAEMRGKMNRFALWTVASLVALAC